MGIEAAGPLRIGYVSGIERHVGMFLEGPRPRIFDTLAVDSKRSPMGFQLLLTLDDLDDLGELIGVGPLLDHLRNLPCVPLPRTLLIRQKTAYAETMAYPAASPAGMDWKDCPLIEIVPGKVSGVPLLKGTRLPADTVLENYKSGSPVAEIAENFDMPEQTIRAVLRYAAKRQKHPRP